MCRSRASAYVFTVVASSLSALDSIHDLANSPTRTRLAGPTGTVISFSNSVRLAAAIWALTPVKSLATSFFLPVCWRT